ncbi:MAG: class I SAM-dependent methyltransferase [Magnetococcales bacterium]|nr:class I SAM-dependent methyltransferase [Magnetococcales bacterium]
MPFDYATIPVGYYDALFHRGRGVQSQWHRLKFARFRRAMGGYRRHLDIGCGPGTLIGSLGVEHESTGIDLAAGQIDYATARYAAPQRRFQVTEAGTTLPFADASFDVITLVELVEHLPEAEIISLLRESTRLLRPQGRLLLSTPDYGGPWPLIEALVNRLGPVDYSEQHITRFNQARLQALLAQIPGLSTEPLTRYMGLAPFLAAISWSLSQKVADWPPPTWINGRIGLLLFAVATKT